MWDSKTTSGNGILMGWVAVRNVTTIRCYAPFGRSSFGELFTLSTGVDLSGQLEAEGIVGRALAFNMAPLTIPAVDDSPN